MTAQDCLDILRLMKNVSFATVDANGYPQVRIIDVMLVEDEKLYFCTARGKEFYMQLLATGKVAITGMNTSYQMIRLNGTAKKLIEQKFWIDRIFHFNPSMNSVYPSESRYILEPFCIENGQLEFFDLGKSPIFRESYQIGTTKLADKGYQISSTCIGCGKCVSVCPQHCIEAGNPYYIHCNHCLHCGLCLENCPIGAVIKKGT